MIQDRKIVAFTKTHAMLGDDPSETLTAAQLKAWWDTAPEEVRVAHNALIDNLLSTSPGDSGIYNLGMSNISGYTNPQLFLQYLFDTLGGISPAPQSLHRQAIINGNFDVWQRGTSFNNAVNGTYTADRFKIGSNTVDNNVKVLQSTSVPSGISKYSCRLEVSTASAGANATTTLDQIVEDYSFFTGQKVTFSGYVKCDPGTSVVPFINDGVNTIGGATITSTSWTKFSHTVTIGNSPTSLRFILLFNRGGLAVGTGVNVAQLQLNAGEQALPFQPRSFAEEERLALRFNRRFKTSGTFAQFGMGAAASSTQAKVFIPFGVRMRIVPTLVYGGNFALQVNGSLIPVTSIAIDGGGPTKDGVILTVTVASGLTGGHALALIANNDATTFLEFDSEL